MVRNVTKFGYRRVWVPDPRYPRGRRQVFEHRLVWERANGPIPFGWEVHHKNGDRLDNRLENLELATRIKHKRIHSGCEIRNGQWWKPCRCCGVVQPVNNFYARPDFSLSHICRQCAIRKAACDKKRRRNFGPKYRRNTHPSKTEATT